MYLSQGPEVLWKLLCVALSIHVEGFVLVFCWRLQNFSRPKMMIVPSGKDRGFISSSTLAWHPWI